MPSKPIIELEKISKIYKLYDKPMDRLVESLHPFKKEYHEDFFALKNISFAIKQGEVVGIVGKNGSGKSTLLKIITGVLTTTYGEIKLNGKITALLELGAGFNPELTGVENLYLSGSIMGYSKADMHSKIKKIITFAEIGKFIDQPIKSYSSGMKARLGFALSINVEPEILIVDEALSVGDVAFQRKCYEKIEHLCKDDKVTVLFVSHSSSVIKQLCSRAIMLHDGEKVLDGKAKDVVNIYEKFIDNKEIDTKKIKQEFLVQSKELGFKQQNKVKHHSFSPQMVSKSKTSYEEKGAKIENVKVVNLENEECNILQFNHYYYYTYTISFFDDFENLKLAMFIKNVAGLNITGKGVPLESKNLLSVKRGQCYEIKWKFQNIFNEGFYFFNCAVNSTNYGEKTILHRIIDAYMIKSVKEIENHSKGMVDIGIELEIKEIKN